MACTLNLILKLNLIIFLLILLTIKGSLLKELVFIADTQGIYHSTASSAQKYNMIYDKNIK